MVEQDEATPGARTHLSDLVKQRRADLRLSLRAVEARTAGEDGQPVVKYGWLHRLERGEPVIPPQVPELEALARALEIPLGRVQDAAGAQFLGIDAVWSESGEVRALARRLEKYTPQQREQLARLLDAFESSPRPE